MHTLYEDETSDISKQIEAWEAIEERARVALATLNFIRDRFPDAVDRGRHTTPRWWSRAAHEVADNIDGREIATAGQPSFARGFLYFSVMTEDGEARIYSSRPVNLHVAFAAHARAGGRTSLIDAMKATTKDAEEALSAYECDKMAREVAAKRESAERDAEHEAAKAQRVVVVGDVSIRPSEGEEALFRRVFQDVAADTKPAA